MNATAKALLQEIIQTGDQQVCQPLADFLQEHPEQIALALSELARSLNKAQRVAEQAGELAGIKFAINRLDPFRFGLDHVYQIAVQWDAEAIRYGFFYGSGEPQNVSYHIHAFVHDLAVRVEKELYRQLVQDGFTQGK